MFSYWKASQRMSKVVQDCFGFASLRSVIGPENGLAPLSQPISLQTNCDLATRVFAPFQFSL